MVSAGERGWVSWEGSSTCELEADGVSVEEAASTGTAGWSRGSLTSVAAGETMIWWCRGERWSGRGEKKERGATADTDRRGSANGHCPVCSQEVRKNHVKEEVEHARPSSRARVDRKRQLADPRTRASQLRNSGRAQRIESGDVVAVEEYE